MSETGDVAPSYCERSLVYPCLTKDPNLAGFVIRYADCDCDDMDPEDTVVNYCWPCLQFVLEQPQAICGCGTVYRPGYRIFDQIIQLARWEDSRENPHEDRTARGDD